MRTDEKIRLQLEAPSEDDFYRTDERPFWGGPTQDRDVYPEETDPTSRLPYGVSSKDFELINDTACAVSAMVTGAPEGEFNWLSSVIVQATTEENCGVVGAIIVHLGATNALWPISEPFQRRLVANGVAGALRFQPRRLVESDLEEIVRWATSAWQLNRGANTDTASSDAALDGLIRVAKDVLRFRQRREVLSGENPIVDHDRRELVERLERLRLDQVVLELLHHADLEARDGRFADALHDLRKFLEHVMNLAAGESADGASSGGGFKIRKDRIVSRGLISHDEGEVFQKLYNVLSNQGSHSIGSTAELYSVNRTTIIEWCLLLSGRMRAVPSVPDLSNF